MRSPVGLFLIAAALSVVMSPRPSAADPIVLTGGVLAQTSTSDLPGFTLTGSDSQFTGVLQISALPVCCLFHAGDMLTLGFSFPVAPLRPLQPTTEIVSGTAFQDSFLRGELHVSATPFRVPALASGTDFSFTSAFKLNGQLSGFSETASRDEVLLFSVPVVGGGVATVSGSVDAGGAFIGTDAFFELQSAPPTPEPATVVLLGSALLGAAAFATRRSSTSV